LTVKKNVGRPILQLAITYIVLPAFLGMLWLGDRDSLSKGPSPSKGVGGPSYPCSVVHDDADFGGNLSAIEPETAPRLPIDTAPRVPIDRGRCVPGMKRPGIDHDGERNAAAGVQVGQLFRHVLQGANNALVSFFIIGLLLALTFLNLLAVLLSVDIVWALLVLKRNLVLGEDGLDVGAANFALIPWKDVKTITWNEGSSKVSLKLHTQSKPVDIYLGYYNIDPKNFVELVQANLSRTAHSVD
jgi:hypothetical protein